MLSEVPDGWEVSRLADVAQINIGGTPSRSNEAFWDKTGKGEAWVSIADLKQRIVKSTKETITTLGVEKSNVKLVPAGTILMSFKLTVGRVALAGRDLYTNEAIAAFALNDGVVRDYLYHYLPTFVDMVETEQAVKGKTLNKKSLAEIPVFLPPLKEQLRIAEILASVDASIQATQAVIEQAERVKRGLMEELLTGGLGSEAIERGEVPEGWLSLKALDIAEAGGLQTGPFGSQLKAGEYLEDSEPKAVRVVMPKDILFGSINFETAAMISGERAIPLEKHRLRVGDALFARRGDLSKVAVYGDDTVPAICGTGCLRLRPSPDSVDFRFLAFLISSESSIEWLKRNAVGATMPNLNTEIIGAMPLVLPPLNEQIRIAKILSNANDFIHAQKSVFEQQNRIKRGLMSDLLTGKVSTV